MASVTLAEASKLQQNTLIAGVIESIVTVNQMYDLLPFDQIQGNAIEYNRELTIGGVDLVGIGGDATVNVISAQAKTPATFTPVTTSLKPMIGDAYVDHFIQTTMTNPNDQKAMQIASKAKGIGRQFQALLVAGDSSVNAKQFDGLQKLVPAAQTIDQANADLTFELLDALISLVKAKDGQVDFFMMPDVLIRKYFTLLRSLGGASIEATVTLPGGRQVPGYRGIPIFRNDWIPIVAGTPATTDIYAGCFDDGSRSVGLAGLGSENANGIFITDIGEAEGTNDTITRVRMYAGLALFSELGIARAKNVKGQ